MANRHHWAGYSCPVTFYMGNSAHNRFGELLKMALGVKLHTDVYPVRIAPDLLL
jgi:hypothetical protein